MSNEKILGYGQTNCINHMFITSPYILHDWIQDLRHGSRFQDLSFLTLPHLYSSQDYCQFHQTHLIDHGIRAENSFVMQDNSIFELRESAPDLLAAADCFAVTDEDYVVPMVDEIVVPEVLRDMKQSVLLKDQFLKNLLPSDLEKYRFAAVVQGTSYREVKDHYVNLSHDDTIATIAIPFDFAFSAFRDAEEDSMRRLGYCRFTILRRLYEDGVFNPKKHHHLLGLYDPIELMFHNLYQPAELRSAIRSNDSSCCFWHTVHGVVIALYYEKIRSHVDFSLSLSDNYSRLWYTNAQTILNFAQATSLGSVMSTEEKHNFLGAEAAAVIASKNETFVRACMCEGFAKK